ncbi:MAG: hypothetical protein D3925_12075 [Candidatus Electrothrix sp. AR5]|nr:hypothetical protein [Candidatus Electrothrix sp. AR5]
MFKYKLKKKRSRDQSPERKKSDVKYFPYLNVYPQSVLTTKQSEGLYMVHTLPFLLRSTLFFKQDITKSKQYERSVERIMNNFTEQILIVLTTRIAINIAKDFWIFLKTNLRKPNQAYQINVA